jgi:hypothetical protein
MYSICSVSIIFSNLLSLEPDSVVGITTDYGMDGEGVGVRVPVWSKIFSTPRLPDRLWGPPNLLPNGYRGSFPGGKAAGTRC